MTIPVIKLISKTGTEHTDIFSYEFTQKRIIRLTGELNDAVADLICAKLHYLNYTDSDKPIIFIINSPGGSVSSGLSILDALQSSESEIHIVCTGVVASMAAVLAAAGAKPGNRSCTRNCEFMLHQPLGGISGQASDIELTARHISAIKAKLISILSSSTGKAPQKIRNDIDRDFWLSAEDAIKYGICDCIVTNFSPMI